MEICFISAVECMAYTAMTSPLMPGGIELEEL